MRGPGRKKESADDAPSADAPAVGPVASRYVADTYVTPDPEGAEPAAPRPGASPAAPTASTTEVELPTVVTARYALEGEFARGGLGRVSLARDRVLGRPVALKELLRVNPVNTARFLREIRFTARLQHPAIVPIYEAGCWPNGEPFYAMKMVSGRTLLEAAERARTLDDRLALLPHVQAVADAVAYAHAQGVIHRDIKPHNILVGEFGETVIIDWGIAKDLRADEPDDEDDSPEEGAQGLTAVGAIVGTPAYMSPEQARGEALDERADVYALGATLYHVLVGAPPFAGDLADTLESLRAGRPPPRIEERAPGIPPDLASIVARATEGRREDRYPSARELARDLNRFTTGQLIGARRYSRRELVARWLRRNRAVVGVATLAAAALAVTAIVGAVGVLEERNRAEAARAVAEVRSNSLTLAQARSALREDPTEAAAWLGTYPLAGAEWDQAFLLAQAIEARGVARHVVEVQERDCGEIAWSADGERLLLRGFAGLDLLSLETGARLGRIGGRFQVAAPTPDGSAVLTVSATGELASTDVLTGTPTPLATLVAQATAAAVDAGGRAGAIGLADGTVLHVDLPSGVVTPLGGHAGGVTGVAVRTDGAVLSISTDGSFRRASLAHPAGERLVQATAALSHLALSGDDRTAVLGDVEGAVYGVDPAALPEGALPAPWLRLPTAVAALAVSADGAYVAAADHEATLRVFLRAGAPLAADPQPPREIGVPWPPVRVFGMRFAPDAPVLAATAQDDTVRLWDLATNRFESLTGQKTVAETPSFSPDGRFVATCGMNGHARVWPGPDLGGRVLYGHEAQVPHVVFLADGRVATDSDDRTVRTWDPRTGASTVHRGHTDRVYGLTTSPDGRWLASAGFDGVAWLWGLEGQPDIALRGHTGRVRTVDFTPDGRIVTAGEDGTLRVWRPDGSLLRPLRGHGRPVMWFVVTPDGRTVVSTGQDRALRAWSLSDGTETRLGAERDSDALGAFRPALLPDGRVAACGAPGELSVWTPATGERRTWPMPTSAECFRILASPDSRTVALTSVRDIRLLDLATGVWRTIARNDDEIHAFTFSPDARFLATAGLDGTARVWRLSDGAGYIAHRAGSAVLGVAFSSDSLTLAATSVDTTVWVGPVDTSRFVPPAPAELSERLGRLTSARPLSGGGIQTPSDKEPAGHSGPSPLSHR